jgi:hypothetical protein
MCLYVCMYTYIHVYVYIYICMYTYIGAGLVEGSIASEEWKEINLKMSQYIRVLTSMRRPAIGREFPNATAAVAAVVVEV